MATLKPYQHKLQIISMASVQEGQSNQNNTLSIHQSRRVVGNLYSILQQQSLEKNSSIHHIDRQVFSGMIIDAKVFEPESKIKGQLLCRPEEQSENPIFSYIILEEQKGMPTKVIYRWTRKPAGQSDKSGGIIIKSEEHIYQGETLNNRKHGNGEYILIKKFADNTEKSVRCVGTWLHDIFVSGTIQDQKGQRQFRQVQAFKSRSNLKTKSNRNESIRQMSALMNKKKDRSAKISESIKSSVSICENIKNTKQNRVVML